MIVNTELTNKYDLLVLTFFFYCLNFVAIDPTVVPLYASLIVYFVGYGVTLIYFLRKYIEKPDKNLKKLLVKPSTNFGMLAISLWLLFSIFVLISSIINSDNIFTSVLFLSIIPLFFFMIIPNATDKPLINISKATMIANLLCIIQSIVIKPNIVEEYTAGMASGYRGIIGNSNVMGLFALELGVSSLILFISYLERNNKMNVIYTIVLIFSLFMLLVSKSRTSLLTFIVVIFISLFILIKIGKTKEMLISVFSGILVFLVFFKDIFIGGVLRKMLDRFSEGNLLASRNLIWNKIINESKIFGHGPNYFNEDWNRFSHNTPLQFWGENGYISGILLGAFMIIMLILSLRLAYKKHFQKDSYIPLLFIVSFSLVSFMEGLITGTSWSPTYVYFLMCGYLIFNNK